MPTRYEHGSAAANLLCWSQLVYTRQEPWNRQVGRWQMRSLSILFFTISLTGFAQTTSPSGPMSNQRVIEIVRAGLSSADVARMISSAPSVDFNLTPP